MSRLYIPQCFCCQFYGHTRSCCNYLRRCLRCSDLHDSSLCTKNRNEPAKYGLCGGPHPENYKGCDLHNGMNKARKFQPSNPWRKHTSNYQKPLTFLNHKLNQAEFPPPKSQRIQQYSSEYAYPPTHADSNNIINLLTSFTNKFKLLINPLISLLTSVINKLINTNGLQ